MCKQVQEFMHSGMGKCFGTWARIISWFNRIVGLFFLAVYLALCKYFQVLNRFLGSNMRYFSAFERNKSQMRVWAPEINTVRIHQIVTDNLRNRNFWDQYFAEPDLQVRE